MEKELKHLTKDDDLLIKDLADAIYLSHTIENISSDLDNILSKITKDPNEVIKLFKLVCSLINRCNNDEDIAYLAAGPLEDIFILHHPTLEENLIKQARKNPNMRKAIRGIWCHGNKQAHDCIARILDQLNLTYNSF